MVSKPFKTAGNTLTLDGIEEEMFIGHNPLLEDDQVMVEQVEKKRWVSLRMKDTEIDYNTITWRKTKKERGWRDKVYWIKKLITKMIKMQLTLDDRLCEEKMMKTLLRLTWLRVYKRNMMKKL